MFDDWICDEAWVSVQEAIRKKLEFVCFAVLEVVFYVGCTKLL
jgi:hypothetical protein